MDKNKYFRLMKETSDITDRIILNAIKEKYSDKLLELVSELPLKRANSEKAKSRPAIFRFSYESTRGQDWRRHENIAAALEMLNISTYTLNYVLDDKGGEKSKQQRNNECITSMIQRELAQDLIRKGNLSPEQFIEADKRFSEINRFTSGVGQYLDGNTLREVEQDHVQRYIQRCEGLTGKFMQHSAEIGGIASNASEEQIHALGEFGRNYGIVVQIVNDCGDYLPPSLGGQSVGKVYQDQFSDLRHGCLTFPAYHVLQNGNAQEREAVLRVKGNINANEADCLQVTKAIIRLNTLSEVKRLSSTYSKQAKKSLHLLPESEARHFLSTSLSIDRGNKFYDAFKKLTP